MTICFPKRFSFPSLYARAKEQELLGLDLGFDLRRISFVVNELQDAAW